MVPPLAIATGPFKMPLYRVAFRKRPQARPSLAFVAHRFTCMTLRLDQDAINVGGLVLGHLGGLNDASDELDIVTREVEECFALRAVGKV